LARQNNNKKRADLPPRHGTTPGTGRAINVALLVSILFVLVLGISGAIYFDQSRGGQAANPQAAVQPAAPPENSVQKVPAQPGPGQNFAAAKIPPLEQLNPTAGPALLKAAQPGYWVEYAAYLGPDYANRLVQRLADMGLKAYVVQAQGAGGKQYYRVRSETGGDRAAAEGAALKVSTALDIFPLVHHDGQSQTSAATFSAPIPPAAGSKLTYWVQFGAYDIESYAQLYANKLQGSGIDAAVISRQRPNGRVIYFVRSQPLNSPEDAQALAQHSQQLIGADTLVGQIIPEPSPTQHL
jgi:cell division septation protein DedD